MKIYIEKEDKEINYDVKKKIELNIILKEMGVSLDSVILVKNGNVCLEDEIVSNSDEIKLLSVVSGG